MEETNHSLPSPTDTPYRTPSSSRSRRSRTLDSISPESSPPPLPADDKSVRRRSNESVDPATDENISPLDPRRFTPTLHASLVAEILSLRRDLEDKTKDIEHLEGDLHSTRQENESLAEQLATNAKESRALKRQMHLLEGGTLTALSDIASERDTAQTELADLRKRLEQSQKKARANEENAERVQALWDQDKQAWDRHRRTLETKVHVVEGRLKTVLEEVARSHLLAHTPHGEHGHDARGVRDSPTKRSSTPVQPRRQSAASDGGDAHGGRLSRLGVATGHSTSLADELAMDDGDDHLEEIQEIQEDDGYVSPDALPEEIERPMSVASRRSAKAFRVLGLPFDHPDRGLGDLPDFAKPMQIMPPCAEEWESGRPTAGYVDSGVQFTPPASPELAPVDGTAPPAGGLTPAVASVASQTEDVTPLAMETADETADVLTEAFPDLPDLPFFAPPECKSASTQTDGVCEYYTALGQGDGPRALPIPTIANIPPTSRPVTPTGDVVLPPRTKNASSQADWSDFTHYTSSGMQTEEIKVDWRQVHRLSRQSISPNDYLYDAQSERQSSHRFSRHSISPHDYLYDAPSERQLNRLSRQSISPHEYLYDAPSEKTSSTASPSANSSRRRFRPGPPLKSALANPLRETRDANVGRMRNDSGPLSEDTHFPLKRPVRSSSLFAGFEELSDEDLDKPADFRVDDDDFFNRPTQKFVLKSGRLVSHHPLAEEDVDVRAIEAGEATAMGNIRLSEDSLPPNLSRDLTGPMESARTSESTDASFRPLRRVPSSRQTNFRRTALISSGAAAHSAAQPRPLGAPFARVDPPPFPVPTRFSSRKPQKSASEGGRSTPTSGTSPTRRRRGRVIPPGLRKARSAGPVGSQGVRPRSRSPPLPARVSVVPDLPSFPSGPMDNLSRPGRPAAPGAKPPPVPGRAPSHAKSNSNASSVNQPSVVDAIAQTMVGEWMFKYVRRRKSFGVSDSKAVEYDLSKNPEEISASVTSTGVRHKRWVWVAPYERAILWSSKQPTTGTALLGKSGRKRK